MGEFVQETFLEKLEVSISGGAEEKITILHSFLSYSNAYQLINEQHLANIFAN